MLAVGFEVEGVDDGGLKHGIYAGLTLLTLGNTSPLGREFQFLVGFEDASLEEQVSGVVGVDFGFIGCGGHCSINLRIVGWGGQFGGVLPSLANLPPLVDKGESPLALFVLISVAERDSDKRDTVKERLVIFGGFVIVAVTETIHDSVISRADDLLGFGVDSRRQEGDRIHCSINLWLVGWGGQGWRSMCFRFAALRRSSASFWTRSAKDRK